MKENMKLIPFIDDSLKSYMEYRQVYPLPRGYILVWIKHLLKDHLHLWKVSSDDNQRNHKQFSTIWIVPFSELFPVGELIMCTSQVCVNVIRESSEVVVTCKGLYGDENISCQWNTLSLHNGKHVHQPYTGTIPDQCCFEMATCSSCGAVVYITGPPERVTGLQKVYALYRCGEHDITSTTFSMVRSEDMNDFTGHSNSVKRLALLSIGNGKQVCHQHNLLVQGQTSVTVYQVDLMFVSNFEYIVLPKAVLNVGSYCSPLAEYNTGSVVTLCHQQGILRIHNIYNPSEISSFSLPFITSDQNARYQLHAVTPFYAIVTANEEFCEELYIVFFPSNKGKVTVQKLLSFKGIQLRPYSIVCPQNFLEDFEQIPVQYSSSHQSKLTIMYACAKNELYSMSI